MGQRAKMSDEHKRYSVPFVSPGARLDLMAEREARAILAETEPRLHPMDTAALSVQYIAGFLGGDVREALAESLAARIAL